MLFVPCCWWETFSWFASLFAFSTGGQLVFSLVLVVCLDPAGDRRDRYSKKNIQTFFGILLLNCICAIYLICASCCCYGRVSPNNKHFCCKHDALPPGKSNWDGHWNCCNRSLFHKAYKKYSEKLIGSYRKLPVGNLVGNNMRMGTRNRICPSMLH